MIAALALSAVQPQVGRRPPSAHEGPADPAALPRPRAAPFLPEAPARNVYAAACINHFSAVVRD
jgi:hypothetical protein